MQVRGLDHVVYVVADVEATVRWWQETFGVAVERLEEWRSAEAPFPSLRLSPGTLIDIVAGSPTGENVAHIAVEVDLPGDALAAFADEHGLDVVSGPATLFGARGTGRGIYVRDPDANTIEIRTYKL
jgi:catechol 2,3-dioxygenase-like lactoylglutathione lyase family enzyme